MNPATPDNAATPALPVSMVAGPIGELIAQQVLNPPAHPGLIASFGRFEIKRMLGTGGMGVVLCARDPQSEKDIAIKIVKPGLQHDEQIKHCFVKEAGHMQKLSHPNIMAVLELVPESPHGPYFVMPYFEMGSLARQIRPGKALPTDMVLSIARQVAEGLHFAHQKGIIHRDLKPANVLMGSDGKICLTDFGLSRTVFNDTVVDPSAQQCEGTAPYMSPGVAAGLAEDTRCDIYAFGAMLYEMLAGEPPYFGAGPQEIRQKILAAGPRPIVAINSAADAKLILVAEGAMGRELRDRYAGMGDIVADLLRIRDGKRPIGPHRPRYHLPLTAAGLRKVAPALAIAAILVLGGLVWKIKPWHHPETDQTSSTVQPAPAGATATATAVSPTPPNIPLPASETRPTTVPPSAAEEATFAFQHPTGILAAESGIVVLDPGAGAIIRLDRAEKPTEHILRAAVLLGGASAPNNAVTLSHGFALGPKGEIYFTTGSAVNRITSQGIEVVAGRAGFTGSVDGAGPNARFKNLTGIAVASDGSIFVGDTYTIRKIDAAGNVTTLAGNYGHAGRADGTGQQARFGDQAKGLTIGPDGSLFVADSFACSIRKVSLDGAVTTIAGSGQHGGQDGAGSASSFNHPTSLAIGNNGEIFIADSFNHTIRRVEADGRTSTLAGKSGESGLADGSGIEARFNKPLAIAIDREGNLWVTDTDNKVVRRVTQSGEVTTIQASSAVSAGASAQ